MKAVLVSLALSLTACASAPATTRDGRVNVHAVRVEITRTIETTPGEAGPRKIVSMGKVTGDSAIIYTEAAAGRREETWSRADGSWQLRDARDVAAR